MGNFFKSPFYFLFCAGLGFAAWMFSFQSELNDANYFAKNKIQQSDFSSEKMPTVDDDGTAIEFDVYGNALPKAAVMAELNAIDDEKLLNELQLNETEWSEKSDEPYSTSPADLEYYENLMNNSYGAPKDLSDYTQIAAEPPQVQYEDEAKCGSSRLAVENILKKSSAVSELIKENISEESVFPRKCLIHVMNQFNLPDNTRASCPRNILTGNVGAPVRGIVKPCVSKAIVNATYNSLMDVTNCMGINPKNLIPKLSNESGMLINTLGGGLDAGIGQLTRVAIEETNKHYDNLMQEIETKAVTKPSCARILKYKSLLKKASEDPAKRCELIVAPENPLKNILYMAMLNRINTNTARRRFENNDIQSKIKKLGLADVNINALVEAIALASYNSGPATAFNALNEYLDKRIKIGKNLTAADFDFYNPKSAKDIDGEEKLVTKIARTYVNAPFIKINDPNKKIKLAKAKLLPEKIRTAHLLSFPEFLIYSQNNFDETQKIVAKGYKTIGAPGYLGFLADKNRALRETFAETSEGANYCSNPQFLKIK